ncbi:MAG TPA: DUF2141 domain-containing protein [Azospirillum sp.]|nr:DUF2141 domain-containing protein [Azospirillum sp.]
MASKTVLVALTLMLAAAPAAAGELRATIRNVKPQQGKVMVAVYESAAAYKAERRFAGQELPATGGEVSALFHNLPEGAYALTVYQDVDGDGKLGRNLVGIPTEPYGFSRDAPAGLGMPSFEAMAVPVGTGPAATTLSLTP